MTYTVSSGTLNPSIPYHTLVLLVISKTHGSVAYFRSESQREVVHT